MRSIVFVTAVLFGCGGDDGGGNNSPDAPNLPACTGVAYDRCADTTAHSDCTGGGTTTTCRLFMNDGFTICAPNCDANNPCPPDKDGNAVTCNNMGRCKATPNDCAAQ